jgi:hypothetical protein
MVDAAGGKAAAAEAGSVGTSKPLATEEEVMREANRKKC